MQVKGNQPTLSVSMQQVMVEQPCLDYYHEEEKGHGRHTNWYVAVYDASTDSKASEWNSLRRCIHVHRECFHTKSGKTVHSDRLYISDLFSTCAESYHKGIRGHGAIENNLHWIKDVRHGEDKNQIKKANGSVNCSTISTMALNIHRQKGRKHIYDAQVYTMAKINDIIKEIRT